MRLDIQLGDRDAARALLAAWLCEDDPDELAEQRETFEALKQALNADRAALSARMLYP
jgi:hypothetical protein